MAVLRSLGAPVEGLADVGAALEERTSEQERELVPPVVVAWDGRLEEVSLRLLPPDPDHAARFELTTGDGATEAWSVEPRGLARSSGPGRTWTVRAPARRRLGFGEHSLRVAVGSRSAEAVVLAVPRRGPGRGWRGWGVFLPLYAAHSKRSWGVGDLGDLEELLRWVGDLGGDLVAMPPITATFLEEPAPEPSPYSPASRLFWNELYLDVERLPGLSETAPAMALLESPDLRREIDRLRRERLVDHAAVMAVKRRVLERVAEHLAGGRRAELERFVRARPAVRDYARFRAACEQLGRPWTRWPPGLRDGRIGHADVDERRVRYHLFAQWAMEEQLASVGRAGTEAGAGLLLDLPLGVHPDSYDVWRYRELFVRGVSTGAPPDAFFAGGQDWGFPPLHPEALRRTGYGYLRASVRHLLRRSAVLRLDHVMGLHRLYWIPRGMGPTDGVYVRYPADELYAAILLEARRAGAALVGEDLGTVPREVPRAMDRHGVLRSFVVQVEARPGRRPLPDPPAGSAASINTHDMPTLAGWWYGDDIEVRLLQGWLDQAGARAERRERARVRDALVNWLRRSGHLQGARPGPGAVAAALLRALAGTAAGLVVASPEDLWEEREPHNVPGTTEGRPNWRRRARHPLERLISMPEVAGTLRAMDGILRGGRRR